METLSTNNISTCLWFDDQAEEAANFYVSIFSQRDGDTENAEILETTPYFIETPSEKPIGSVMTVDFELEGQHFTALNGGPHFTPNPSISFFIHCENEEEVDYFWEKLVEGGTPLMPLDSYPFSPKYGWVQDRYGISWQLILSDPDGEDRPVILPSLMFCNESNNRAEEAINFYTSVFANSKIGNIARYPEDTEAAQKGSLMYGDFLIGETWVAAMDSGVEHDFNFNEGISLVVSCQTQDEIDYYWEKLTAEPKAEVCGWLKDKFGVSWQIIPVEMDELFNGEDTEKSKRTMEATLQMKKLDINTLKNA